MPKRTGGLAEYYAINGQKETWPSARSTGAFGILREIKEFLCIWFCCTTNLWISEKSEPVLLEALRLFPNDYYVRDFSGRTLLTL